MYTNINQLTPILQEYKDKLLRVTVNEDSIFIELDDERFTTIVIDKESLDTYSIFVTTFNSTAQEKIENIQNFPGVVTVVTEKLQQY